MVRKGSPKITPESRRELARDLARREKRAVRAAAGSVKGHKLLSPAMIALLLVVCTIVVVASFFQTQQQILVNENKQHFVDIQKTLKSITSSSEFSARGSEWLQQERCEYSPPSYVAITYKARIVWTCTISIGRNLSSEEDSLKVLRGLADEIWGAGSWTSDVSRSNLEIMLVGPVLDCSISVGGGSEDEGDKRRVGVRCMGGAYRSWYQNSEQRSTAVGRDAWRTLR